MKELLVIGYDTPFKADDVLNQLNQLEKDHLIDLGDAAVVVKNNAGKVRYKHFRELAVKSERTGGWWGLLLGTLLLHPGMGGLLGASVGELSSSLEEFGIDDQFITALGTTLNPGSSALFILVRHAHPDEVVEELKPFGGTVLRTSLSPQDEARLRTALHETVEAGA